MTRSALPGKSTSAARARPARRNINEEVINALRDAIGRGHFRKLDNLSEQTFENYLKHDLKWKISRAPIRHAIATFAAEGILRVIPKIGMVLSAPTDRELREIWDARVQLEDLIITQLARMPERNLSGATAINREMDMLAHTDEFAAPTAEEHAQFIDLDQAFHEQLAFAANYPQLANELNALRFKLQLAAPVEPFPTKHRFKAIVNEHADIIDTLRGAPELPGVRPDINAVRVAFLVHMRNSAVHSWKIDQRLRNASDPYWQHDVLDVPALSPDQWVENASIRNLLEIRLNIELCAVTQLAMRPDTNLRLIEFLHQEMKNIADKFASNKQLLPDDMEARFINLDISFHSALCFLAGMLVGVDFVNYVWHKLRPKAVYKLDGERIHDIKNEHEAIIKALRDSRGKQGDVEKALDALEVHLFGAFIRNRFDATMLAAAIRRGNKLLRAIEKASKKQESEKLANALTGSKRLPRKSSDERRSRPHRRPHKPKDVAKP